MTTVASDIYDLFLNRISDYSLNTVFTQSGSFVFGMYIESWLLDSITDFSDICTQDLTYTASTNTAEGYFTETLSTENKVVLSRLMVKYWMDKRIKDVLQMNLFLQDHDYKVHSAAQNLTAKQKMYTDLKEELDLLLGKYAYKHNNWSDWRNQIFYYDDQ